MAGFNETMGSWNTIPMPGPRSARRRRDGRAERSAPSNSTCPAVRATPPGSKPISARASIVLPLPDSPTTATNSPGAIDRDTSSSTRAGPACNTRFRTSAKAVTAGGTGVPAGRAARRRRG